ncbi:MAG: cytochrome C oxidase subunit IV family protein [Nannocystaceae bacterium]|nr:cytochrome C oxidase subunit IV family protein [Nannocystaceae bacterium]
MVDAHKIEDDLVFLNGEALGPEEAVEIQEHVSPLSLYYKVLSALFVLTGLTYAVSYLDLGELGLPVAMFVAVIKVSLVCTYFMHLKHDDRYHVFVFLSTLLFVGIFFTFILFDLSSRDRLSDEQGTFFQQRMDPDKGMPSRQPGFGPGLTPALPPGAAPAATVAPEATAEPAAEDKAEHDAGAH